MRHRAFTQDAGADMIADAHGAIWLTFSEVAAALKRSKYRICQLGQQEADDEEGANRLLQGGLLPFRIIERQKMVRLRHAHQVQILRTSDLVDHFGINLTTLQNARNLHPRNGRYYSLDDIDVLAGRPIGSLEDRVGLDGQSPKDGKEPPHATAGAAPALNGELEAGLRHISMMPHGPLRTWHLNDLMRRASARGASLVSLVGASILA
jgi:hypothetical protein